MKKHILVVDDEPDILELLALHLGKSGFRCSCFSDVSSFYAALEKSRPDLVILDLMLPDEDGLDICKKLRNSPETLSLPIIMLTARGEETDRVLGLELGADDYVTKPFSPKELVARVRAVLRRTSSRKPSRTIEVGDLLIDLDRYTVTQKDRKLNLTLTEFKILRLLASNAGVVFSREEILDYLWGNEKAVIDRTIDVHIRNLREKLCSDASLIRNLRGVGYKLEA